MVILFDASVIGPDSGSNVGYDSYRNVMTNSPTINGKPDMITDALSVGMTVNPDNECSIRRLVGKKRSRIDGWMELTIIQ